VFKVETIGDCYVAVAGLPDPQEDHAIIMAKFATDCISKMGQLTAELAEALGPDTSELALRIGLHSGSVTGGVLRGQKSRFQLFGDTMNTASRMESNGEAGRIHISKETANELIAKGKSSWVTPRTDKVVAKGKGELQTYWATSRTVTESVVSSMPGNPGTEHCTKVKDKPRESESIEI
jgi:class 3 adenylate cyclase